MSDLRVGNISISGSRVNIGDGPTVPTYDAGGLAIPPDASLGALRRLPISAATYHVTGLATAVTGVLLMLVRAGFPQSALEFLTEGAVLVPIGVAFVILGLLRGTAIQLPRPRVPDAATARAIDTLRALLLRSGQDRTVESLCEQLGWTPRDVVRGLGWLRALGELVEDVDLDSGLHVYSVNRTSRDLSARLRDQA